MAPTLAHFELRERIGLGAMGAVYRAEDVHLGRVVAVKLLLPEVNADSERRSRFMREAQAAAGLNHPNIAMIFEVGEVDLDARALVELDLQGDCSPVLKLPFFAMEHVPGRDLGELLDDSAPLDIDRVVDLGRQIARALEAAHRNGIVHRDLKPGNVRVTPEGRAKLLDFGLAKLLSREAGRTIDSGTGSQLTLDGMVMGTLPYLAPEQLQGLHVDGRADLFALGVILYEMITGEAPFPSTSMVEYARALLVGQVERPSLLRPETPEWLDDLAMELLATDPDERPMSAAVVRLRLEEHLAVLQDPSGTTASEIQAPLLQETAAAPRSAPSAKVTAAAVLLVMLAGLAVAWWYGARQRRPPPLVAGPPSLAVLPLSAQGERPPLVDGLSAFLSERLQLVPALAVRATQDVRLYADIPAGDAALGRRLMADWVLGGSVEEGEPLRVVLNWTRSTDGAVVWSKAFEIEGEGILQIQDTMIQDILDGHPEIGLAAAAEPETRSRTALRSHLIGIARLYGPRPSTADVAFHRALDDDPEHFWSWLGLARAKLASWNGGDDARASGEGDDLAADTPRTSAGEGSGEDLGNDIGNDLGNDLGDIQALAEAREAIERALEIAPEHPAALLVAARLELAAGHGEEAALAADRALAAQPAHTEAMALRARALASLGELDAARSMLEDAVRRDRGSWRLRDLLGQILLRQDDLQTASLELAEADRLAPDRITLARSHRSEVLWRLGQMQELVELHTKSPRRVDRAELARYLGLAHMELGHDEEARAMLGLAVELSRGDPERWYDLGEFFRRTGRDNFARASFDQARKIWEDRMEARGADPSARGWHAFFEAKRGRCDRALPEVDDALEAPVRQPGMALLAARTLAVCQQHDRAVEMLSEALRLGLPADRLSSQSELEPLRNGSGAAAFEAGP